MATVGVEVKHAHSALEENCSAKPTKPGEGLRQYYLQHIHDLQLHLRQKTHNLNRLEAQRNDLNSRGLLTLILFLFFSSCIYRPFVSFFLLVSTTIIQFDR
jgi:hypothetical protein